MPRVTPDAIARILERVVLQPFRRDPDAFAPAEQAAAIRGDQVREAPLLPEMAMEPEAATHRVDHARSPIAELDPLELERGGLLRGWQRARRDGRIAHWQATTPS